MTREKLQKITISGLSILIILLAFMGQAPTSGTLLLVLIMVAFPDIYNYVTNSPLFLAILAKLFQRQVIKFFDWADKNAAGKIGGELDLTGAPWLPPFLRDHYIRLAGLMEMKRYLEGNHPKKKPEKKPTSRGKRGKSS